MGEPAFSQGVAWITATPPIRGEKKAGVVEHPEVFDHAGLLIDGSPGAAGLPFS
jgi:hypothetical protein